MCVEKLIIQDKVSYNILGISGEIVFSGIGFRSTTIYIAVLLKTTGLYTLEINDKIVNKQGSGVPEFCVLKNLCLESPNIYTIKYTSTEPLAIYELNFAFRCSCDPADC